MSSIIILYDQYTKTLKKCYYFKNNNNYKKLLNEIGYLRGLAKALYIYNINVYNIEYYDFIKIQKKLINEI